MNKPLPINLIDFNIGVGKGKPLTINGEKRSCPFCNVGTLTDIIDTKEDMIFLKNKYIVLEPSDQFVLIEGADCNSDMNLYTPEKMTSAVFLLSIFPTNSDLLFYFTDIFPEI